MISLLLNYWHAVFAFTSSHPVPTVFAIMTLVGLLHDALVKYPRLQGVAKVCKSVGLTPDLLIAGLKQLFLGAGKAAVVIAASCLFLLGCPAGVPAKTATQARADARAAVTATEAAWMLVAHSCVDVASETGNGALLSQCAAILDPVRVDLEAADDTVNAWTDATSNAPLACAVSKALLDIEDAAKILEVKGAALQDAETLVSTVVQASGGCVDGGK